MSKIASQKGADRFVRGANAGLAGALSLFAAAAIADVLGSSGPWVAAIGAIGLALIAYGLGAAIRDRRSDEFTLSLWHAGTGFALMIFALVAFFVPAILTGLDAAGMIDGQAFPSRLRLRWELVAVCLAFFGAIRWRIGGPAA